MNIQRRVILCAGHGGDDPGATGQGTTEAAEVISIVDKCVDILRKDGQVEVIQVPNELNFIDGINWVNNHYQGMNDGLSIEVHKNSASVAAHGVETWFYGGDSDSEALANLIQAKLGEVLPSRGVKPDTSNRWGQLGWMRDVNTWSILVEMGFVSDGGDPVGNDANQRYATALAKGILNVWGLALGETMESGAPYWVARIVAQAVLLRDMDEDEWNKYHKNKTRDQLFDEFNSSEERAKRLKSYVDAYNIVQKWQQTPANQVPAELQQQLADAKKLVAEMGPEFDKLKAVLKV